MIAGDNIEAVFDSTKEAIILQKYSYLSDNYDLLLSIAKSINTFTKEKVIITDTSRILASSDKNIKNKKLDSNVLERITNREENKYINDLILFENDKDKYNIYLTSVIANSEVIGGIIIYSSMSLNIEGIVAVDIYKDFLSKYIVI